jgi:hypothetical protein
MEIPPLWSWQVALRDAAVRNPYAHYRNKAPSGSRLKYPFPDLSESLHPSSEDIDNVSKWARQLLAEASRGTRLSGTAGKFGWATNGSDLFLTPDSAASPSGFLMFLESEDWARQLPQKLSFELVTADQRQKRNAVILHTPSSVKGLEADAVVIFAPRVTPEIRADMYVAFSRARLSLELIIGDDAFAHLPSHLGRDFS